MFGFSFGGGSAGTDRGRALAGWGDEWVNEREARSRYDQLYPGATSQFNAAAGNLGAGAGYFKDILSSRPDAMAAVAPELNEINARGDATRTAQANLGTSRSGGTAALNQQAEQLRTKAINDAIFGVRPQAAQQVASIGAQQGQLSEEQLGNALRALGLSSDIVQHIVNSSLQSRQQNIAMRQANFKAIMDTIGGALLKLPTGGAGGGGLSAAGSGSYGLTPAWNPQDITSD